MKVICSVMILLSSYLVSGRSETDPLMLLTNGKQKYWDAKKGCSWRLSRNGELLDYYYHNNVRIKADYGDIVIYDHSWRLKGRTIIETAGVMVIGEYDILKLTHDTLMLKSNYGMYGTDTLFFQRANDQVSSVQVSEPLIGS